MQNSGRNASAADSDTDRAGRYFETAATLYERAHATAGEIIRRYRVAGAVVELRFASARLADLFGPSLAHAEIAEGAPALTVLCWDLETGAVEAPPRPWDESENFGHGEVPSLNDGRRYFQYDLRCGAVTMADREQALALFWLRSPSDLTGWEIAAPLRALINWWASSRGFFQVHAGAVGFASGGALLIGRAGAGKSHTALASVNGGLGYISDDTCLVGDQPSPEVRNIYCSAKVYERDLHRFPWLHPHAGRAVRTPDDKLVFFLQQIAPERILTGCPIRVVLLPRVTGRRDTVLAPATPAEALLAMAPDNVLRWPSVGRQAFARFAAIVKRTPRFRLEAGTDLAQIPRVIEAALKDAGA